MGTAKSLRYYHQKRPAIVRRRRERRKFEVDLFRRGGAAFFNQTSNILHQTFFRFSDIYIQVGSVGLWPVWGVA
jgi:hypothetical protein